MSNSKLEIKIGEIEFSGEGDEKWLSEQLDKLISRLPELISYRPSPSKKTGDNPPKTQHQAIQTKSNSIASTLSGFLKEKSATTNQAKKFLATAVFLHSKGNSRIATKDISKALNDGRQSKLTNASECLNQQVKKGYCEKDGSQFYVTPEGEASIG